MELSKRLKAVADLVLPCEVMADIGTDHGYVPITLCLQEKVKRAIACDIKKGPLQKAVENIHNCQMEERIETRLGAGLEKIMHGETETIVIAGMGGMLMIDILAQSLEIVKGSRQLVLQPQLDVDKVRRYLHQIGFTITEEIMVWEDKKFYNVLSAQPGEEVYSQEEDYLFGKVLIEKKDSVLKEYLLAILKQQEKILVQLEEAGTLQAEEKRKKLMETNKMIGGILQCLM